MNRPIGCGSRWLVPVCLMVFAVNIVSASERSFCAGVDDGTGTVELPPQNCSYLSPDEVFMIIDGLPPGTTIELDPLLHSFICLTIPCGQPGGGLGGERELFEATLRWQATGTGALSGFTRLLHLPVMIETHSGPRTPGDPVQIFPTDLFQLQGALPPGDPDFQVLQLSAGTNFGMPSPGQTTLSQRLGGHFSVDSFFDITYRIDFVGAPGSALDGLAGSTVGTLRMAVMAPPRHVVPCIVPDNGTGTAELPPPGCGYRSPTETMEIVAGLPPGTTMVLRPVNQDFVCASTPCGQPGGNLGGEREVFDSTFSFRLVGTGDLAGFNRELALVAANETHSAPRTPWDPVQFFNTDTFELQAGVTGDPDFSSLQITAGTVFGMPSPGQTILTDQGDGTFLVDSFFDISYQIDFVGAPGSILYGMSGSTVGRFGVVAVHTLVFEDGFETGDTNAWSGVFP
jgi:hypothetical protein